jgi:tetratricopeptide (TPR) repeat protein
MFRFVIVAVCCVCLSVTPASADDDTAQAGARYKQAFTRFEDALQAVRETGDTRAQAKMLEQVIEDLDGASKIYQDAGKTGEAAACRLLAARSTRLQGKTGRAPKLFAEAERLARQSDARPLLVQVLIGQSFCELVEVKNLELADAKAGEALRVASTVDDAKLLFEAMCLMSEVDVAQSELASAWDWIERAFTLAPKVKDKDDVLFYGHVDRSQVCYQLATRADTQPVFDFAEQMAQQAAESADAANAIATRRGWKFLGQQSQRLAKTARQRRELIQMQRGFHKLLGDVQTIRAFNPQGPGEVLVTRKFVSEAGVVPPWSAGQVRILRIRL